MEGVSCQSLSEAVDSYTLMSHAATPAYYTVQYTLSQCTLSCHFHIKFGVILPYFTRYRMAACLSMCDMKKCVCVSGCPRWQSTRCPLCDLTLSHSISMPTCPLAPSARYTCLTWSYTLGRLAPFSLSRAVCQWPHCYSELLQMARAQIASASSHPSQAAALRSSSAGARVPARSVTPPPCLGLR